MELGGLTLTQEPFKKKWEGEREISLQQASPLPSVDCTSVAWCAKFALGYVQKSWKYKTQ
jgi:hypothetical protein